MLSHRLLKQNGQLDGGIAIAQYFQNSRTLCLKIYKNQIDFIHVSKTLKYGINFPLKCLFFFRKKTLRNQALEHRDIIFDEIFQKSDIEIGDRFFWSS